MELERVLPFCRQNLVVSVGPFEALKRGPIMASASKQANCNPSTPHAVKAIGSYSRLFWRTFWIISFFAVLERFTLNEMKGP